LQDSGTQVRLRFLCCVVSPAGFIGSHLAKRLKEAGHHVVVVDWRRNEYFKDDEYCTEFHHSDLRTLDNCIKATAGCEWVFNLAADMGGMGFIQSNHSVILFNNTMISFNMLEAARRAGAKRFFYASSACIYPEHVQTKEDIPGLKESDAWPAQPQDAYGLEKLVTEEICMHYAKDFAPLITRVARFHNIYGPQGTWCGGREKAPAAFSRKVAVAKHTGTKRVECWGNGKQTRSFCFVDDCVEGILRLTFSEYPKPLNLGSDEMVSMNQLAELAAEIAGIQIEIDHIPGPEGVRGRNSDNTLIKQVLGWAPAITLKEGNTHHTHTTKEKMNGGATPGIAFQTASRDHGLCHLPSRDVGASFARFSPLICIAFHLSFFVFCFFLLFLGMTRTYHWIEKKILEAKAKGEDISQLGKSKVVAQSTNTLDHIPMVHDDTKY
jgi:GDP-D-mannose 3',5'-epimerase